MIARGLGISLLVLAGLGWAGLVLPARREQAAARDEFARAREERQRLRLQVAELERRVRVRARITAAPLDGGGSAAVADVRRSVLRAVDASRVSGVNLAVSAGRAPVAARVRLSAEGRFSEVVPLTGLLAGGPPALVLDRVRLSLAQSGVAADVEGFRLGAGP
jgi:hypothetical protein